jgi:NodT family efflux transporter outer membrane factor (OMF) lipoprotein
MIRLMGFAARGLITIVAAVAVVGCGSPPPVTPPEAQFDLPAEWTAKDARGEPIAAPTAQLGAATVIVAGDSTHVPVLAPWWTDFGDARLDALVVEAIAHNFELQAAAARLDAARARSAIAGADQYPSLDVGLTGQRRKQNFIGLPIGGPGGGGIVSSTTTSYALGFSAFWEIDLWGRIRAGKVAALADQEAAAVDLAGAHLSLAAQTAHAWFAAIEAALQLELAESTARSFRESAEWVRGRYERGLRPSLDLRLALANLATAEATAAARRQQLDAAVRTLEVMLGRYPAGELTVTDSLAAVPPPIPAGLPATLLTRRPDLVAAERRLVAADSRVAAAWRAQFPRLSLTGDAGTSAIDIEDLADTDFSVWSLVGNLAQPLFQGGRLRANVKLARAGAREASAAYQTQLLRAFSEVERALVAEEALARQEREMEIAVEQSVAAQRLAENRYASGLESYVTVLEAQRRALINQATLLTIRRQRLDARVNLHVAMGGGFQLPEEMVAAADTTPPVDSEPALHASQVQSEVQSEKVQVP